MKGENWVNVFFFVFWFLFLIGLSLFLEDRNSRRDREVEDAAEREERMFVGIVDWQVIRLFCAGWIGVLALVVAWRVEASVWGWLLALAMAYVFIGSPLLESWVHWQNRTTLSNAGLRFHVWKGVIGMGAVRLEWDQIARLYIVWAGWKRVYIEDASGNRYKPLFGIDVNRERIAEAIVTRTGLVEVTSKPARYGGLVREVKRWVRSGD